MTRLAGLLTALALGAALLYTPAVAQTVGIGTTGQGSITYSVGAAIAKAVTEKTGIQARVQPIGGQNLSLPSVSAREIEFGIGNELQYYQAVQGIGAYDGQKLDNLRAVAVLMPLRVSFFVAKDSPIKSVADLKGKRVPAEFRAQAVLAQIVSGILANAGLTWDDVEQVPVTNVIQGAKDFAAGKADVMFFALGAGQVQEVGATVGGLRALPIDPSEEPMEWFREKFPVAYATEVEPSPALHGILEPTYVAAFDQLLVTHDQADEDTIYKIAEAIHESKEGFQASFKPFGNMFMPERMAKEIPVGSYHPGAVKFYKEAGIWSGN